jgi:hypothetical protein
MHKQYLTNEEDIEFPNVSSAKQMPDQPGTKHIGKLEILPQFHLVSNVNKEYSIVF